MNNGYPSVSIEDIARLAGETCVYRGASQGAKTTATTQVRPAPGTSARFIKLLALLKR